MSIGAGLASVNVQLCGAARHRLAALCSVHPADGAGHITGSDDEVARVESDGPSAAAFVPQAEPTAKPTAIRTASGFTPI